MSRPDNIIAAAPLAYSVKGAAAALSLSTTTIGRLIAADVLIARYAGSKLLIPADEINRYLATLPYERE
ncbi:DNA-binding protein [Cryobacterium sp. Sr8]|uniref:helix-turn-helix domain-containing protein n=1 Tax=Cryobacterium sp. Sr8 TaxID=1259203 RepID=UPI0010690E20|nr:helix-turn-helix domain-containing protein [Cryobacterium sp. Sr8]TFD80681.1 DNA-binding protein [Cryobacterium sp. Sr8]